MSDLPFALSEPIGTKGNMGLVVLQSDETIEQDFRRMVPERDVAVYASRVPSAPEVTGDTLARMAQDLPAAAALFPRSVRFDVVGYGCTSGASVIGAGNVARLVREGCDTTHVTEPVSALIAYAKAHDIGGIAFLSPYIESVSAVLRGVLAEAGVRSDVFGSFGEAEEAKVARIDPKSIHDAAVQLGQDAGVDAVFCSCTNLRCLDVLGPISAAIGKPALSSNQVLGWHMRRLIGLSE